MSDITTLLSSWKIPHDVVKKFTEEEITIASLPLLSDETLSNLIPKAGPRSVFQHHLQEWKRSAVDKAGSSGTGRVLRSSAPSPINHQQPCANSGPSGSGLVLGSSGPSPFTNHQLPSANCQSSSNLDPPPIKKRREGELSHLEKLQQRPDINDLHKYLKSSVPGVTVLGYYQVHDQLDNYSRDLLAQEVIFSEIKANYEKSLSREEFSHLADAIVDLFPNESKATWFDVVQKGRATVVEGRLRFKYYSIRRGLISAQLVTSRVLQKEIETTENTEPVTESLDLDQLKQMQGSAENWPTISDLWKKTFDERLILLEASEIHKYIELFPFLKEASGWNLIADDGVRIQSNLSSLLDLWNEYSKFLLTLIKEDSPDFDDKVELDDDEDEIPFYIDEESAAAGARLLKIFLKLPSLFKVRTLPKSPKAGKSDKCWRPSRVEVGDAFCLHLTDIAQLQEKLEQRKGRLSKHKFSLQPVPVIIGPPSKIRQCFIVLNDHRWEVAGPFDAIFGCFKMYFGLNACYPPEARHIWLYLQQTLLGIKLSSDHSNDKGLRSFLAARVKQWELYSSK